MPPCFPCSRPPSKPWLAARYTAFLVRDTPLFNNTIHQHLNMLRNLVAHAGLPTKRIKNGFAQEFRKCYLTWEE